MLATALAVAAGCGEAPPTTEMRIDLWNGDGTAALERPATVTLTWFDEFGVLFKDRSFAVPAGPGTYLGSVIVRAFEADLARPMSTRSAVARGQAGGVAISEGWGKLELGTGVAVPPLEITLQPLPASGPDPNDADGDGVPDPIDNCPSPNPDQTPGC
jgi:hypothetical protein